MRKMTTVVVSMAVAFSLVGTSQAADIVIGVPNWSSATAGAHVLKEVFHRYLGVEAELQEGTNTIIMEAMDKGAMQVHPEIWWPNVKPLFDKYVDERNTVLLNTQPSEGKQALCVSKYTAENYPVKSVYDLLDPEKAKAFDTDGDGKGNMWLGATGWGSVQVDKVRAHSYGFDLTFNLEEQDEAVFMASLDAAVKANKPIVFSCPYPHQMFKMYDLVMLEEPAYDEKNWHVISPQDDPEWLNKSSAAMAWPAGKIYLAYQKELETSSPKVAALFKNYHVTAEILSDWSYFLLVEKLTPDEMAKKWVDENKDLVESWLPK